MLLGNGSANAITVKKKRDAPGDPSEVWALGGSFCAIKDWNPAVADCIVSQQNGVTFPPVTLKDGTSFMEKLTSTEGTSYSYELVEGQLPVMNYAATLRSKRMKTPPRSEVHWDASSDAKRTSEQDAQRRIAEILEAGVSGIKKMAIATDVAEEKASRIRAEGTMRNGLVLLMFSFLLAACDA